MRYSVGSQPPPSATKPAAYWKRAAVKKVTEPEGATGSRPATPTAASAGDDGGIAISVRGPLLSARRYWTLRSPPGDASISASTAG